MMTWLGWSWWHLVLAVILGTIGLGLILTVALGVMRGFLWLLTLTTRGASRLWAWLTGTAPSSWGTAHWASEREIDAKGLFQPGSIPLGTWQGKPLFEAMGGHVCLVGPPRSRKSWGLLMPAIAGWDGSVVVNDPRGELWTHTHVARAAKGPTHRFSPTTKNSCNLNVLDAVRWGEPEEFGDVARLVHGLLSPEPGEVQSPFAMEAEPLLCAVVCDRHAAGEGHLPGVLQWMVAPGATMKQKAEALLRSPLPVVQAGGRRLLDKSDRLQSSVWSAALSALTIYQDPLVAEHTDHSDLDLGDLQHGTRPVSIFLTPPFSDVSRLRSLLGTLTEMLVSLFSSQQDTPRQRVLLALDELANLGRLDELERGMSFLQGCGVQILLVLQNVPQFRQIYGRDSPLLASVGTQVHYTPSDLETADYLSDQLGVTTVRLRPESQTRTFWGILTSTTIGTSEHPRPLLTADEVRRWPETAAVVLSKGLAPILCKKLGTPVPESIDLSPPRLKRIAAIVGAGILAGSVGAWAFLWPTSRPTLNLTTETTTGHLPWPLAPSPTRRSVTLPVVYTGLPEGFTLAEGAPQAVQLEVEATGSPADYGAVVVSLAQVREGSTYVLLTKSQVQLTEGVRLPTGVMGEIFSAKPAMVQVSIEHAEDAPRPWVLIDAKARQAQARLKAVGERQEEQILREYARRAGDIRAGAALWAHTQSLITQGRSTPYALWLVRPTGAPMRLAAFADPETCEAQQRIQQPSYATGPLAALVVCAVSGGET